MNVIKYPFDQVIANLSQLHIWELENVQESYLKSADSLQEYLNKHRYQLDSLHPTKQDELKFYTDVVGVLITWFLDNMPEYSTGTVWKQLVSLNEVSIQNK